ncbi:hypothetical protein THIOM_005162 [Candidatus Thiomargarita nelsonii]|uniref:Uncharacterized protein n=1 Tax=Candidatus Thiomargarita nelsonii TaxID=1003181 RepID=A0A176RU04_9GAMM|nr:hypothetical protein THIOM_005162 [Candidatus Thiomargarita nelsonii]
MVGVCKKWWTACQSKICWAANGFSFSVQIRVVISVASTTAPFCCRVIMDWKAIRLSEPPDIGRCQMISLSSNSHIANAFGLISTTLRANC